MSEGTTQGNRSLQITTPVGDNKLLLESMHGTEALGRLFQYDLQLISENEMVKADDLLGKDVTIKMELTGGGATRCFHGYISRFVLVSAELDDDNKMIYSYQATVVPWAWFMTRKSNCRIFQDKTVLAIIEKIFGELGIAVYETSLQGSYRTWEYCVQYRETDFNFVSRLMENEGMYYFFKHEDGKHTMVICDSPSAHEAAPNSDTLHFGMPAPQAKEDNFIWGWGLGQEITSTKYSLTDYDPLNPGNTLFKTMEVSHSHDSKPYEVFDYPGGYVTADEGKAYITARLGETESPYIVANGISSARSIFAGATFTLAGHPGCAEDPYLITGVTYQIKGDVMASEGEDSDLFTCQVTAIPATVEYRAPRLTPKPFVQGPQTAVVVGKSGEEIWTDEYGRVKVKFFWDRADGADENSSCWIRVSHTWAGKQWGVIFTPRMGQEVIVDFLEGDPDRPIITGRVYNGDMKPPYDLPAKKTQSTIKTRSSKQGTPDNFNEIRFEDEKGSEQLFIHAEKNMDIEVEADETHSVGNNRTKTIGNNESTSVKGNRDETVDKNETITINENRTETVEKDENVTINGARSETVAKDVTITWGAKLTQTIEQEVAITMNDAQKVTVAKDQSVAVDGARSQSVGKDDALSVSKKLAIDAGDEITITTGDASISMKKDGTIIIKGKDITIQGSGKINVKADGDVVLKGSKIGAN